MKGGKGTETLIEIYDAEMPPDEKVFGGLKGVLCRSCLYNQSSLSSVEGLESASQGESELSEAPFYTSDATSVQDTSSLKVVGFVKEKPYLFSLLEITVFVLIWKYVHTLFLKS